MNRNELKACFIAAASFFLTTMPQTLYCSDLGKAKAAYFSIDLTTSERSRSKSLVALSRLAENKIVRIKKEESITDVVHSYYGAWEVGLPKGLRDEIEKRNANVFDVLKKRGEDPWKTKTLPSEWPISLPLVPAPARVVSIVAAESTNAQEITNKYASELANDKNLKQYMTLAKRRFNTDNLSDVKISKGELIKLDRVVSKPNVNFKDPVAEVPRGGAIIAANEEPVSTFDQQGTEIIKLVSAPLDKCEVNNAHATNDLDHRLSFTQQVALGSIAESLWIPKVPVTIGIIDSGLDITLPIFQHVLAKTAEDKYGHKMDIQDNDKDGWFDNCCGGYSAWRDQTLNDDLNHGTPVAALAAGRTLADLQHWDGGKLTKNIKVFAIRVVRKNNDNSKDIRFEAISEGIAILDRSVPNTKVVNISLLSGQRSHTLQKAISDGNGMLFVVAAGNNHLDLSKSDYEWAPATYSTKFENVLTVAALNSVGSDLWIDSNKSSDFVEIAAPGESVWSVVTSSIRSPSDKDGYYCANGTSYAAPIVTFVASLLFSKHPELKAKDVKVRLLSSCDWVDSLKENGIKHGCKLNATKALATETDTIQLKLETNDSDNHSEYIFGELSAELRFESFCELGEKDKTEDYPGAGKYISVNLRSENVLRIWIGEGDQAKVLRKSANITGPKPCDAVFVKDFRLPLQVDAFPAGNDCPERFKSPQAGQCEIPIALIKDIVLKI